MHGRPGEAENVTVVKERVTENGLSDAVAQALRAD
jgi:hypothetical protein